MYLHAHQHLLLLDVWNFLSAESFYFWDKLNHSFGRFRSTLFIFESNYFDDHKGLLIFSLPLLPKAKRSVGNKESGLEKIVVDMLRSKIKLR